MLERIIDQVRALDHDIYGIAIMSDEGLEYEKLKSGSLCQNSYSIAKLFTTTAVGMLWDAGKLGMDEKVCDILAPYVPDGIDPRWREVTVDHLLRHRAGFGRGLLDIDVDDASEYDTREYLDIAFREPLVHEPGGERQYTDAAFYMLSRIVSEKAGTTCDRYLEHALFDQMRFREVAWSRCPQGHPMGATGLYINARDMVKLGWTYLNEGMYGSERIFSADWARLATERGYELYKRENGYIGKGGMYGQLLIYSPEKRFAAAWHCSGTAGLAELNELVAAL